MGKVKALLVCPGPQMEIIDALAKVGIVASVKDKKGFAMVGRYTTNKKTLRKMFTK